MSKNINVNPDHYKTAGRERPGQASLHTAEKRRYGNTRANLAQGAAGPARKRAPSRASNTVPQPSLAPRKPKLRASRRVTFDNHGDRDMAQRNYGSPAALGSLWPLWLGGGALMLFSLWRGSRAGYGLAALGLGLLYRGAGRRTVPKPKNPTLPYERGIRLEESITIDRPPQEIYRFWRRLENLPRFMKNLELVQATDDKHSHWVMKTVAGETIEWDAEIINEKENELIAWRTLPGAATDHAGSIRFQPGPGGRGATVKVLLQYDPPAGALGSVLARLFGKEPERQVCEDLLRLKREMEADLSRSH